VASALASRSAGGVALGLILVRQRLPAVRLLGIGVAFAATSILRLLILTMLAVLSDSCSAGNGHPVAPAWRSPNCALRRLLREVLRSR